MFTPDHMPNPAAWTHAEKVRLSKQENPKYFEDLEKTLKVLCENRNLLCSFAEKSLEIANTKFAERRISDQWLEVWRYLEGDNDEVRSADSDNESAG